TIYNFGFVLYILDGGHTRSLNNINVMEKYSLDQYFKETAPEDYRFLDYYQYRKSKEDFTSRPLVDSMEGPVKSREGETTSTTTRWGPPVVPRRGNTHTTMVGACVPLTLWRSLDPVVKHRSKFVDVNQFWNEK
ncbi:1519_t:CDS:2, partial [Acaulospora colombiana]